MATLLYRLGRFSLRRRRTVAAVWLVVLATLGALALTFMGSTSSSITIPGTESTRALEQLERQFPQASGATGTIVLAAPQGQTLTAPEAKQAVMATTAEAADVPGVVAAVDPYTAKALSADGRYGLIQVQFDTTADQVSRAELAAYENVGAAAERAGIRVERGGEVLAQEPEIGSTEGIGVAVAAVVLVITFGSLVAAGMTLLTALVGVGAGMAGLFAVSGVIEMTSTAPVLALMLGLAVGIDYALFITSRYRQHLVDGVEPEEAAGRAVGTAGSAVVFAGATVVIALAGLSVVGIPFLTVMGLAAAGTVTVAVLVAISLLPAIIGFAGRRILPRKVRRNAGAEGTPAHAVPTEAAGFRWGRALVRHRVPVIVAAVVTLGVLAIPTTSMRLALPDDGTAPVGSANREAYDLISEGFGEGFNGRLVMVVESDDARTTGGVVRQLAGTVQGTDGVVAITPPQFNANKQTAIVGIIPSSGPSDASTEDLVHHIRAEVAPVAKQAGAEVALTGITAIGIDVSEKLADALPIYLLVVVGLSVVLLMLVFRSILVPVKAALGFLLTVGATFGVTVAVFQWGWLKALVGLDTPAPLVSFLPVLLIGILFGLAMDYEVFLVSRMREDFVHGASAQEAVVSGTGHGARVVTAAAIIMTSVFAGFVLVEDPIIKSMGFALAFGVAIDAVVVRLSIVPAVVSLLGRTAWWLPHWLDRALPNVDIEGERLRELLAAEASHAEGRDPAAVR
jgi:RND superfamily putative drug exporter